ncbi:MAG TPA: hypothetical protein EYO59_00105 [Chromatiaceae bacterium]|nr:hypothetical protein [Chromatiaceae bacterium]
MATAALANVSSNKQRHRWFLLLDSLGHNLEEDAPNNFNNNITYIGHTLKYIPEHFNSNITYRHVI